MERHDCQDCEKQFKNKHSLQQHAASLHNPNVKKFMCDLCGASYITKWGLTRHMRLHYDQNNNPGICRVCGKSYHRHDTLQAHERTHEQKIKCEKCAKEVHHMKVHSKYCPSLKQQPVFKCRICTKKFKHARYLQDNSKSKHNPTKPYQCENCLKRFNYRASLSNHRKNMPKLMNDRSEKGLQRTTVVFVAIFSYF